MEINGKELALRLGGRVIGDDSLIIRGVGSLNASKADEIIYASGRKNFHKAASGNCGVILTKKAFSDNDKVLIIVDDPRSAFVKCLMIFQHVNTYSGTVSERAIVSDTAQISKNVTIMQSVNIMENVSIGEGSVLYPGVFIGNNVKIGKNCLIHPNVVIGERCVLGDNVLIHAGVVIGADGFGFAEGPDGKQLKIPQIGAVVVEDDVEIGANTTIDRATSDVTLIGSGTKIDNLVQIAHNVRIGKNNIIAAQTAIGGSTVTGDNCIFAGQVGVADHCVIKDRVTIAAKSGVQSKEMEEGKTYFGIPAREIHEMRRILAATRKLAEKKH